MAPPVDARASWAGHRDDVFIVHVYGSPRSARQRSRTVSTGHVARRMMCSVVMRIMTIPPSLRVAVAAHAPPRIRGNKHSVMTRTGNAEIARVHSIGPGRCDIFRSGADSCEPTRGGTSVRPALTPKFRSRTSPVPRRKMRFEIASTSFTARTLPCSVVNFEETRGVPGGKSWRG